MKNNYTHIAIVLDKSGSMSTIASFVREAYEDFVKKQKELDGEATLTLAEFSSNGTFKYVHEFVNIQEVPHTLEFYPGGLTALDDALGKVITDTGVKLKSLTEDERPSKVLIVVISDGEENNSTEYTTEKIKEMTKHQEDKYAWQFIYIGANVDARKESLSRGVSNSMDFSATKSGVKGMSSKLSAMTAMYRSAPISASLSDVLESASYQSFAKEVDKDVDTNVDLNVLLNNK